MSEVIVRLKSDHVKVKGAEYVEDLVRCRDCKWFDKEAFVCFYGSSPNRVTYVDEEDFCSSGEVRDE